MLFKKELVFSGNKKLSEKPLENKVLPVLQGCFAVCHPCENITND